MNIQVSGPEDLTKLELKSSDFNKVRNLLHDYCGINMHEGKEALVKARMLKRIRRLDMKNFSDYLNYVENDETGSEFLALVDVLTTNKTSFFREKAHFDFIRTEIIPDIRNRDVTWWSAGCSTGEEPVSWAITWLEEKRAGFPGNARMLATDISTTVLQKAKQGLYRRELLAELPDYVRKRYFRRNITDPDKVKVSEEVRSMIRYGRLNLKDSWPMKGPFHIIMCRNVMIYFDQLTQKELVDRFYNMLEQGGYLFLGHSESISGNHKGLTNIRPAVYRKK